MAEKTHPGFGSASPYPGAFVHALRSALACCGWSLNRWTGIAAHVRDGSGRIAVLEPEIPFRRLRGAPRGRWPEVLEAWLGTLPKAECAPFDADAKVVPLIVNPFVRLVDGQTIAYAVLAPHDLALIAVSGEGDRRVALTEERIRASGRDGSAWFESAVETMAKQTASDAYREAEGGGGIFEVAVGDGLDACRVLLLDEHFPNCSDGFFVSLPSRDRLLFAPVRADTLGLASALQEMGERSYREASWPISNRLYWVRQGQWRAFEIRRSPGHVEIAPSPEFVEVLRRLLPGESPQPPALPSPPDSRPPTDEMPN